MLQGEATSAVATTFFAARTISVEEVVRAGVGGNTFRAFRNLPVRPSVAFREWAALYVQESLASLLLISDRVQYAEFIHNAADALCAYWRELTGTEMGFGRGAKLLNLVLKKLACLNSLSNEQREMLIRLQHVPLDSYTIVGLMKIIPSLAIPKNATMKYIQTPRQYTDLQNYIIAFAADAGVPAIYYDILTWDMAHQRRIPRTSL